MNEVDEVFIQFRNGDKEKCSLIVSQSVPWEIFFSGAGYEHEKFEGGDLFKAFLALRKRLEESGYKLLCNGARKDVLSSGMSRSMGGGRKAYVVKLGSQARMKDILDIFDYAEPDLIVSSHEQQQFNEQWFESL